MINNSKKDPKKWNKSAVGTSRGDAYLFFDCDAEADKIEEEIPFIREAVQTPNELELALAPMTAIFPTDFPSKYTPFSNGELRLTVEDAKRARMKYMIRASQKGRTNRQVADSLADITHQAYQSPLYQEDEQFRGQIVYEENGHYKSRD